MSTSIHRYLLSEATGENGFLQIFLSFAIWYDVINKQKRRFNTIDDKNAGKPVIRRPITTEEYFNKICSILKEKALMPDILDYALATNNPIPMTTYEFDLKSSLAYGGSEGIYLDLWIEYHCGTERIQKSLGTFKTLREDREAMQIMGRLLADFIVEEHTYVNANLDNFTWEGADVHAVDDNGKKIDWGYSCGSMERALIKKDELLKKYPSVIVRDNATRKEKIYHKAENM